uniref:HCNGP-like protein, putative n=1 Tax=Theileria annulata TaxID=5874 RepID=A0A3B0NHI4_THEAN
MRMSEEPEDEFKVPEVTDVEMPPKLLEEIERLKAITEQGVTTNQNLEESLEFKNPYLLEKIMAVFDIKGYCSNYNKEVYDPEVYEALANEPLDTKGKYLKL